MRVIMTCGGTGGHIYPALAIADIIKMKNPDAQIMFIGTKRGMENQIVPAHGYMLKTIPASGFNRRKLWKNVATLKDTLAGYDQAKEIIRKFQPDLVFGTGGYVCGPVVLAAHKMGIRTAIHEQNAFAGMTNKLLSKSADKVFISFKECRKYFKREENVVLTGNPLRRGFVMSDRNVARQRLSVKEGEMMVLCFGGSQGSPRINDLMLSLIDLFDGTDGTSIYFVTGRKHYDAFMAGLKEKHGAVRDNIKIFGYIENMPEYMGAADVVISRSGALSVAELTACGKPAILIPSPYVADNHQYYNAKVLADKGAAILIEEKDLEDEVVINVLSKMRGNRELIKTMGRNSQSLARTDAAEKIYEEIRQYLV